MPDITSNGITLHVRDTGGSHRPVVLIHGWPLCSASWADQVPALVDDGFRVIAYDRRGFGDSDKPAGGYDYDTFAADLDGLLTGLGLTDVTLVGFSMGGGEVARYVARYGESRLRSVALVAAVPPYLLKTEDNPDGGLGEADVAGMQEGVRADREGFLGEFLTTFFSADGRLAVTEDQRQQALALARPARDEAVVDCIGAFSRTDFREDLARITVPTLVVHGDQDAIVPFEVSGRRSAEAIASSRLVLIEGAPHGLNVSHAEQLNHALIDFLAI